MKVLRKIGFSVLTALVFAIGAFAQNVNVTATGGTTNATYATVKAAFDAVNAGTHTGAVTFDVVANTTEPSNTSAVLNSSGAGAASYTSLLIRPAADNVTVSGAGGSGAICSGRGLIELNGADNVTIDGDNPNSAGTNRNLSFSNICATINAAVIRIAMSNLVGTANNNTFKNINVSGNAVGRNTAANSNINEPGNPTGYSHGIYAGGGASTTNAANPPATFSSSTQLTGTAAANNLTIENSQFINAGRGINLGGAAQTIFPNFLIRRNLIGNPNADAPDQIYAYGISASGSNGGVISDNTVYVESFLNVVPQGIALGSGGSANTGGVIVERNFVKRVKGNNLTAAAGNGIHVFTDFPNTVRNNFVSGVGNRASNVFVGLIGTYGIFIGRGPGHRIYNNTVNLTGDQLGSGDNISAALGLNVGTGNGLDVRNNILINTQTQSGAANPLRSVYVSLYLTDSVRNSSFNLTLNNNIYFQGSAINSGIAQIGATPGGANFYMAANFNPNATTPANNLRAYTSNLNTAGTNDNQSKVLNPLLVSDTDLHLAPGSPAINAGANVGIFNDIDGQIRAGVPDIGADEIDGAAPQTNDIAAYAFVNPANGARLSPTTSFTPSAQFANYGTAAQTNVTVRYQILDSSNAVVYNQTATIASIAQNQIVTVNFPATTLTPAGNYTIRLTSELAGDQSAANDSISGTIFVLAPLTGTVSVGAGEFYTSLTNADGLFEAVNTAGAGGNIVINLTSNLTAENGSVKLNELPAGATLTIKPSGAARTISGAAPINTALIALNGADNVTIDGSLNGGTDRSLTVNMISGVAVIYLASGANGAQNNVIKNVNIVRTLTQGTTFGIFSGGNTLPSNGADNDNNRFQNNVIQGTTYGISSRGASAANKNTGTIITQNVMTATGENRVRQFGIHAIFDDGAQITDNRISGIVNDLNGDAIGIALGTDSVGATTATGSDVSNALVARNRIGGVENQIVFSAIGILVTGAATGTNNIVNNWVSGITAPNSFDLTAGIFVGTRAGGTQNVYYNSVSLTGTRTEQSDGSTLEGSFALVVNGGNNPVNVRNNIFSNTQTQISLNPATAKNYAVGIGYAAFTNLIFDNNVLYAAGAQSRFGLTGNLRFAGTGAVEYTDLAAFRAATNTNVNSSALDPRFVSANDLHIQTGVPTPVESRGVPIAGITTDYDGDTRSPTTPDIGADERNFTPVSGSDAAATQIISPSPNLTIIGGAGSSQTPRAVFTNNGATALTNVQVRFTITGPGGYNYTDTQTIANLPIGASVTVTFAAAPAFTTGGTYTAMAKILTPDQNATNDFVNAIFPVILPLTGSYNVGANGNFTSLTNAGGIFDTLNRQGASGSIVINLTSDLLTETGAIALNELAGGAAVTIKPVGVSRKISGTGAAIIKLSGADNVTIDGSLNGGTDRSLLIVNEGTGAVIWIADGETAGGNNNTVKNCNIVGLVGSGQGIVSGSTFQLGQDAQFPMSNNTIQNNRIVGAENGMFIAGAPTGLDQNWTITDNVVGGAGQGEQITFRGIIIGNSKDFNVSRNQISNVVSSPNVSAIMSGIMVAGSVSGGTVTRNEIRGVRQTNPLGFGSNGIYLNAVTTDSNLTVANNFISDVASYGFNGAGTNDNGYGIMIQQGGGYKIYYNAVNLNTNQTLPASITAAINIGAGVSLAETPKLNASTNAKRAVEAEAQNSPQVNSIDLRGNIFANAQTVGTRYAIYSNSPSGVAVFSDINYNDYFAQNVGFSNAAQPTLANWQTATGKDQNSKAVDPLFVSATNLHLRRDSQLINGGTPISGITIDIDGQVRDAMPDIGADEFNARSVVGDFDGDNRTDLIVFRPTNGTWYIRQSANNIANSVQFGQNGDVPTPGDYDGDGQMDAAVFRPSNGSWYIQQSSNGAFVSRQFGLSTDKPVQADYDGDGKTDIAVFRDGFWYLIRSSDNNFAAVKYGQTGDVPVQGNYDGDGRADFAVYRSGVWFALLSSTNASSAVQFGLETDVPLIGDFDGDGKSDQAVFRAADSNWYILRSTGGFQAVRWGLATDIPVVGDYDGDGKSDVAVFRPSDGVWYVINSSNNANNFRQWGQSGDIPIPANYQSR
jgi:FG-GAP-like repeat/NPCBM-associated, NEW3 domain of alpha-galactosidase